MGLIQSVDTSAAMFIQYLNTGSMFDIATGQYEVGANGSMILNGGLSITNGVSGRQQLYKSTTTSSLMINALARYPGSEIFFCDTEHSLTVPRILNQVNATLLDNGPPKDLADRVVILNSENNQAEVLEKTIRAICEVKEKEKEKYLVTSPILNPKTRKPFQMWVPTLIGIDSWAKLTSKAVEDIYEKNDIGSSGTNMVYMKDGNVKNMLIRRMVNTWAVKYGVYFCLVAHIGDKVEMNPYAPTPKDLQFMKGSDKVKNAGSDFNYLTSIMLEMRSAKLLQDSNKQCLYPDKYSTPNELSQLTAVVCRCKNNASGTQIPFVISQHLGEMSDLTNYNYLKENGYYGLVGSKISHYPALMPDTTISRQTVRDAMSENYRLARSIELLSQLCFVQNNWSMRNVPVPFDLNVKEFAKKLLEDKSIQMNDILESRGYWTYDTVDVKIQRPYLSLFDIMSVIAGKTKLSDYLTSAKKK